MRKVLGAWHQATLPNISKVNIDQGEKKVKHFILLA